ncbi:MAG: hypothetical protein PHD48_00110 [Alphaproteobacteria bacterium]|nr:hypothetical protein [Alphaproteobacteria bacterium]
MSKQQTAKTPEEIFNDATEGREISSGDLSLLTSGYMALKKMGEKPLNEIELQAVYSMIAYVGYTQGVCENTVASILTAKFGGEDVKTLPSRYYQQMIEFLVDLEIDKVLN